VPALSIIIPVYNAEETIQACIESALDQTFTDFEIIVCDGKSVDSTLDLLTKYQDRIILSSKSDQGIYDAMNRGLDLAQGEWVYFLGADDVLANKETLHKTFSSVKEKVELILGRARHEHLNSTKVPVEYRSSLDKRILWRNTVHHQSAFYHRSLFNDFRYNIEYKVLADYHFNIKLFLEKARAVEVDTLIAICDARGISKQFSTSLYKEELRLKSSLLSWNQMLVQRVWVWLKYLWKNT
jgi:putative colanic acid biosynthesis glycosyltransferase